MESRVTVVPIAPFAFCRHVTKIGPPEIVAGRVALCSLRRHTCVLVFVIAAVCRAYLSG